MFEIAPAKQVTRKIKGDDVASAAFEDFATANHAADDKEHIVGGIAITSDDVVAIKTTGPALERRQSPL